MKKSMLFALFLSFGVIAFAQSPNAAPAAEAATAKKGKMKDHANAKGQEHAQAGQAKAEKPKDGNDMREWGLSEDQKTKFKALNEAQKENMKKLMDDTAMSKQDKAAQRKKLKADYESQVKGLLTPEQFAKWEAAKESRENKAKAPGKGRGDKEKAPGESQK